MKYSWLILVTLVTPVLLLFVVGSMLYRPGLPPAARASLDGYVALQNRAPSTAGKSDVLVTSLERAAQPRSFAPAMSRTTFGEGYYFGVANPLDGAAGDPSSRPAPFPATEVWCVDIESRGGPYTVLLAQHEDMYVGEWILHELVSEEAAAAVCR